MLAHCLHRLKCDRQVPCFNCSKRGDAPSCDYSNGLRKGRDKRDEAVKASEAHVRLQKLEQMVTSLMQTTSKGSGTSGETRSSSNAMIDQHLKDLSVHSSSQTLEPSCGGHLDIQGPETNYLGATHWATILENVGVFVGSIISRSTANVPLDSRRSRCPWT